MKPIQTNWGGYRFRSRLEARWAVFFSNLGLRWEYEPEGFEGDGVRYLPDFRVHYPREGGGADVFWFEVKPTAALSVAERRKLVSFAETVAPITLLDGPPSCGAYVTFTDEGDEDPAEELGVSPEERWGSVLWSDKERFWWSDHFLGALSMGGTALAFYMDAMDAALSARFEFGEAPAHA